MAGFSIIVQINELAGILIDLYLWNVICIYVPYFYDSDKQFTIACVLNYLAGITVCHIVSTAGAGLHDKFPFTVGALALISLLYIG